MTATTNERSSVSTLLTVSVSFLQDVIKIKCLGSGYYSGFVGNATAVVSCIDSGPKSSKLHCAGRRLDQELVEPHVFRSLI